MTSVSPALRTGLLVDEDRDALLALLDRERDLHVYLRSLIHEFGVAPREDLGHGRFYGAWRGAELRATAFVGNARNMSTAGDPAEMRPLLERVAHGPGQPRLFVGPESHAREVRRYMAREGLRPRLDRRQSFYVLELDQTPDLEPLPLRPAEAGDTQLVVRAHAAMIEEDLEIPLAHLDLDRLRSMAEHRISAGRIWVLREGADLLFKTEEVSRTADSVLVGGVFTAPSHRGRGLASRGMASWARTLRADGVRRFALHVNAGNRPAYRAYERAGFREAGTLRLVLTY